MCGGAIISDFKPSARSRRVTADFVWPDLSRDSLYGSKQRKKKAAVVVPEDVDDDFEADFQEFEEDDAEMEEQEVLLVDSKPFAFAASKAPVVQVEKQKAEDAKKMENSGKNEQGSMDPHPCITYHYIQLKESKISYKGVKGGIWASSTYPRRRPAIVTEKQKRERAQSTQECMIPSLHDSCDVIQNSDATGA